METRCPATPAPFTRLNWLAIRDDPERFRSDGVRVLLPPWQASDDTE